MSESPEERMANNKVYSVDAFAAGVKSNHPEYAEVDNQELVAKMLEKYPNYRSQVDYSPVGGWEDETPKKKDSTVLGSTGETSPTDSALPTEAPKRDAFKIIDENPYELGRLWNRAIAGSETGKMAARSFYGGSIDFEELAYYNKVLNDNAPDADDWLAGDEENVVGSFLLDIVRTIPESLIGLVDASLSPEAAASAATGAAAGAAVGTVFAPVTAAAGGAAGAAFAGSGMLTFGSTLLGKLSENGVDITNPQALEAAWNDEEFITPLAKEAAAKAGVVGSFDAISAGLGGAIAKGVAKSGAKKIAAEIAEYAAEGSLGASGEALGSLAAGDEINWRDVALEGLADPAAGISGRLFKSLSTSLEGKLDENEQEMLNKFEKDPATFETKINISKVENASAISELKNEVSELEGAMKSAPKKQKAIILKEKQKKEKEITRIQRESLDALDNMSNEEVAELGELAQEIIDLSESTKSEEMTDSQKEAVGKVVSQKRKELQQIKQKSKIAETPIPSTEVVETEASKNLNKIDLGENETIIENREIIVKGEKLNSAIIEQTSEKDGIKTTKYQSNRSNKSSDQRSDSSVSPETVLNENEEINLAENGLEDTDGNTTEVTKVFEVREDANGTKAAVVEFTVTLPDGTKLSDRGTVKIKQKTKKTAVEKPVKEKSVKGKKTEKAPTIKAPKEAVPVPSKDANKKLAEVAEVRKAAPKAKYNGVKSRMKSNPRGYSTVIEKTDKRTGKVTRYEGDVFVDPKTKKVSHTVTQFVDGVKGKTTSYKDVNSFRDAINKKIKAGAKESEAFVREYNASPEGKSSGEASRTVEFVEEKTKAPVKSKVTVEKVTYKSDGKDVELSVKVNGSNRQRQLPYASVTNVADGKVRRFETKQQYDKWRNGSLARRNNVKVETISEKVQTKDAEKVFVQQEAPTEVKGIFKRPTPVNKGLGKAQKRKTTRKPFQAVVYAQVPQESRVYVVRDSQGKDRLVQKTIGKDGEYATYEVEEKLFAGGIKRYEIKEGAKGYENQSKFIKSLREESVPKAETEVVYKNLSPEFIEVANQSNAVTPEMIVKFDEIEKNNGAGLVYSEEYRLLSDNEKSIFNAINNAVGTIKLEKASVDAKALKDDAKSKISKTKEGTKKELEAVDKGYNTPDTDKFIAVEIPISIKDSKKIGYGWGSKENGIGYIWQKYQGRKARKAFKKTDTLNANMVKTGDIIRSPLSFGGSQYIKVDRVSPIYYKDKSRKFEVKEYAISGTTLLSTSDIPISETLYSSTDRNYTAFMNLNSRYNAGSTAFLTAGRNGAYGAFKKLDVYTVRDSSVLNIDGLLDNSVEVNKKDFKEFVATEEARDNMAESFGISNYEPTLGAIDKKLNNAVLTNAPAEEITKIQNEYNEESKKLDSKSSIAEEKSEQTENQTDVKDGFTILETNEFNGKNSIGIDKSKLLSQARAAVAVLKLIAPKANIRFVNSSSSFDSAMNKYDSTGANPLVEERGRAFTNKITGELEIYINLDIANPKVIAHEVFHVYFHKVSNSNPELAQEMAESISKMLKKGNKQEKLLAAKLESFISNYDVDARPEEFLAELAGILSDNINAVTPTRLQNIVKIIKDAIYKALDYMGIEDGKIKSLFDTGISEREDAETYLDFIESFAKTMNSYAFEFNNPYPTENSIQSPAYMSDMASKSSLLNNRLESYETKLGTTSSSLSYEYLEDTVGRELLDKGYITTNHSLSEYENKAVVIHQPDRAFSGVIKYKSVGPDGMASEQVLMKGHGGMYYPMRFFNENYVWASTEVAAKGMAKKINTSVKANGGKGYMILVIGKQDKTFSSSVNINGVASVVESLTKSPEFGLSESEFVSLIKESVKDSVGTGRNKKANRIKNYLLNEKDPKKVMSAFQLLMNPEVTTFSQRKSILTKENGNGFISKLSKHIKSKGADTILAWNSLMGSKAVFTKKGTMNITQSMSISKLEEGFLKMINEPVISGPQLTGMAHMVIEVDGEVEAFRTDRKSESHHGSYPFAIRAKKDGAVKIRLFESNENTFKGRSVYDANKGTEFTNIDTSSINNIEELVKARELNSKLSNTVLPPTSGTSESVILNPTASSKKTLNKEIPVSKNSRKQQEENYEAIKEMNPEEFKENFIMEKARSKAQSFSQKSVSIFGKSFTYTQRKKISKEMLSKTFTEKGVQMTFMEHGQNEYLAEYNKAEETINERNGEMKSKSSLANEEEIINERLNEGNEGKSENFFAKIRSRRGLRDLIEGLGEFAIAKGLVFTETQKKVRTFLESMTSQLSFSAVKVRLHASRLRKLAKTPESLSEVRSYLTESNPEKKLEIAERILAMPKGELLISTADSMRALIDGLSQEFLDNPLFDKLPEREFKAVESYKDKDGNTKYRVVNTKTGGIIDSGLTKAAAQKVSDAPSIKDAIRANLGSYLHTSYRFFNSKNYKITDKALNKAYKAEYEVAKMNEFKKMIESGVPEDVAIDRLKETETINRLLDESKESIDKYVKEIEALRKDPDYVYKGFAASALKIPKTALQQKKGIPEHIADLLGVEKDPVNSFIDSAMVMHKTIYKTQMIAKISDAFGGDFVKDTVTEAELNSGEWVKVEDKYSPINGKYVKGEIFEMLENKPLLEAENAILNAYFKGLKVMRKSKVVWNLPTWRKNLTGGVFFIAANGVVNPAFIKDLKNRIERTRKGEADPQIEALLKEMSELGLIGADVNANLIDVTDAALNVLFDGDYDGANKHLGKMWNKAKNFDAKLAEKYTAIDDYTKLIIYRVEKESFAKKIYGKDYASLTETQQKKVRDEAGEFVKQNTPTFSRLPKWYLKSFSKVPLGDFLGFKLESWRSITSNLKNAAADLKKGMDKNIELTDVQRKEYVSAGRKRMTGSVATLGARAVVPIILTSMFLGDDDEEIAEDAISIRPDWMEGHSLIVKNISENGDVSVYNYSMEDPYGEISDALMGDLSGFSDFMSPNMLVKFMVQISEGRDSYGRDLWDKSDPLLDKMFKMFRYGGKSMIIPPSLSSTAKYQENQMLIRDYKYNLGSQFFFSAREYTKGTPYNELTGRSRKNRLESLDQVRTMYEAVLRVAQHKQNTKMQLDATRVLNRFSKIERAYIQAGYVID